MHFGVPPGSPEPSLIAAVSPNDRYAAPVPVVEEVSLRPRFLPFTNATAPTDQFAARCNSLQASIAARLEDVERTPAAQHHCAQNEKAQDSCFVAEKRWPSQLVLIRTE